MCRFLSKEEWRQPLVKIIQCPALKRHVIIIIIIIIIITIIIQLLDLSVSTPDMRLTSTWEVVVVLLIITTIL